jgi:tripartite-type tricarboxylate transporter receptor subunit TctC
MTGIDIVHVPYKSSPLALTDVMAGQIHLSCVAAPAVPPFVKSGKVRALGVTSTARTRLAPGLSPIAETVPGYDLTGWYGLLAPRGTPPEIIARINAAMVAALKNRDIEERLLAVGAEPVGSSPAEFGAFLRRETVRWEQVLKDAGIRPPQ